MTNLIRIPSNTRARLTAAKDDIVDKTDVVGMQFKHLGTSSEANIIRIPARTQAYLTAERDDVVDVFDVTAFEFKYGEAAMVAPWAYWKMEETSGTRYDSTPNARDLTPEGHVLPTYDTGKFGNAAKNLSDGVSPGPRFYLAQFPTINGNEPFSMAFWLKTNYIASINSYFRIVGWDNADSYDVIFFELHSDSATWGDFDIFWTLDLGRYNESWEYSGLNIEVDPDVHPWTDDVWHLVYIIYDGSGLYLYVDNVLWGSVAGTHGITVQPDRLRIAESREVNVCNWSDEIAIFENYALTEADRNYLWNGGAGRALY